MKKLFNMFGDLDISKSKKNEDGTLIVCGYASSGAVDSDGEIITPEAMKAAIPDYMKFGAVREMHGSVAAGTALNIEVQDDGRTYFECLVVDSDSVKKCELGVFKGFSIGGKVKKRNNLNKKQIDELYLIEISLVDRPANPEAKFECFKAETLESNEDDLQEQENPSQEVEKTEVTPIEEVVEVAPVIENDVVVEKGLYSVARLAELVEDLKSLAEWIEFEEKTEEHTSMIPDEMKTLVLNLSNILNNKVKEELNELQTELKDESKEASNLTTDNKSTILIEDDLIKAGSRNSKSDAERIQKIHDLTLELGAVSPSKTFKSESIEVNLEVESIEKFNKVQSELQEALTKAIKLEEEKDNLTKRIKELEDLPRPRKASVLSIGKSQDYQSTESNVEVAPVLKGDGSVDELATIFKTQTFQSGLLK